MAVKSRPDYAEAYNNLGSALFSKGQLDEAITQFQKALKSKPDYVEVYNNLGSALFSKGRLDEAITQFQKALEIRPGDAQACDDLRGVAWLLATCPRASIRNGPRAVGLAQEANRLSGGGNPVFLCTLAAAYAEAGRFPEAVMTAQQALQSAATQTDAALVNRLRGQLELYQAGSPFRDAY